MSIHADEKMRNFLYHEFPPTIQRMANQTNHLCSRTNTTRTLNKLTQMRNASHTLASKSRIGEVEVILDTKLVPQRQASVETCPDFISPTAKALLNQVTLNHGDFLHLAN